MFCKVLVSEDSFLASASASASVSAYLLTFRYGKRKNMQERHRDRRIYFQEQGLTTRKYVIPYIETIMPIKGETRVLEIGCGEGGNLVPFLERGCESVGIDINKSQIEKAKIYLPEAVPGANVKMIAADMYEISPDDIGQFDLIFMRDVIEHIHDQEKFMAFLPRFVREGGKIFFGFPPWCMPFGGHQQICQSRLLSKMPFFHLLNKHLYAAILRLFKESEHTIDSLLEIKETGLSINRFEGIVKKENYFSEKKTLYFINPNYEIKFGLKPRKLNSIIAAIPYVRDFFTTCYYCVLSKK